MFNDHVKKEKIKPLCMSIVILFVCLITSINAIFLDWIWTSTKELNRIIGDDGQLPTIPFEYKSEDEKFLEEASKFTDLMKSSSLDICQHKIILQIKSSCNSMTEEELSKMSVNLLNCQSEVDGRKLFPCTEIMSLKECTKDMDANMWNAYHLMNNRARAVCLAARKTQFHALSEIAVNKLMATTHDQIKKMKNLLEGQQKLETLTFNTLNSVEKGNFELLKQQDTLKMAQNKIQEFVTNNLEQLTAEKALIAAGNKELAQMAETLKKKLDEANRQLKSQSIERTHNHREILKDLEELQKQTYSIFQLVDSSTEKLLMQHELASLSYNTVIENLIRINDTVDYLLKVVNMTRADIDERLYWLQSFFDGTGNHIERLLSITFHVIYLLTGMLFASFLNFSSASRALLAIIVPLNLFVTYKEGPEVALDLYQVTLLLVSTVSGIALIYRILFCFKNISFYNRSKNERSFCEEKTKFHIIENRSRKVRYNICDQWFTTILHKFIFRMKQLLFLFMSSNSNKISNESSPKTHSISETEAHFVSSNVLHDKDKNLNKWIDSTPIRDNYGRFTHGRVSEWDQSEVDYPRDSSPFSTASGSPRNYCSAVCRSGRRCKNTTYCGSNVCYRHHTTISENQNLKI